MEEFKPKRKNSAPNTQNAGRAPQPRKSRAPKPQGENAANAQHKPRTRLLPQSRTPPLHRVSRPRVRAARAMCRMRQTARQPRRAPRASAAAASPRSRNITR